MAKNHFSKLEKKKKVGQEIYNGDKTNINSETIGCFMGFCHGTFVYIG